MHSLPAALIAAAISIALGQFWKFVSPLFVGKAPALHGIFQSGGMPSSHTAAVASMALLGGLREGFNSSFFALSAVFTAIVVHDAIKVRGAISKIIKLLRKTIPPDILEMEGGLPSTIGHTYAEVFAGLIMAVMVAFLCNWILP